MTELQRVGATLDLESIDTSATPGFFGDKKDGQKALDAGVAEFADLQERLFAASRFGDTRRVLLVLQAMDTAGKGGIVKHVVGSVDPQGTHIHAFKKPTEEEMKHDFLWRVRNQLPEAGIIGVFDRSHYEDVLIARVRGFAEPGEIERRYGAINDFEARLADQGVSIIKCMLHVGADEQKARLAERLANPEKHWKYNPGDLDERAFWPAYREAYETALERTSTQIAPWHVVPSDKKWFRNLAVGELLHESLTGLDLGWPVADFDVEHERARLTSEKPVA